jgi:antirestriction protein
VPCTRSPTSTRFRCAPSATNWLHAEGATTADLSPQAVITQFADAYIGPFTRELDYTAHHMAELGWTQALQTAGIPEHYLDTDAINRDWFHRQVRHIDSGTYGRIEVFHRREQH